MAGYSDSVSNSSPPHMMILVGVVGMILAVPAILAEQPSLPEVVGKINPAMAMIAPVLLIVVVRWLSSNSYSIIADPIFRATDSWSIHRAGGSPVGLALAILVVLVMVWHKSSGEDASE